MRHIPILNRTAYDRLCRLAERGDEALADPTPEALRERVRTRLSADCETIEVHPALIEGEDDPVLREGVSFRSDAEVLRRWMRTTLETQLPAVKGVVPRRMVSLACFALARYARPRWTWAAGMRFSPQRHLLATQATRRMTGEDERIYHTAGRLWWMLRIARLATSDPDPDDTACEAAIELFAHRPDFYHRLVKRPMVCASRPVLRAIVTMVLDATPSAREHLTERRVVNTWLAEIAKAGAQRSIDMLDAHAVRALVRGAAPPNKSFGGPMPGAPAGGTRASGPKPAITVLSLGGGVQSSALFVLAARGEIDVRPDVAVFADTGWEPRHVYKTVEALRARYGDALPVETVSHRNLFDDSLRGEDDAGRGKLSLPVWIGGDGAQGQFPRHCTSDYKIAPIVRYTRARLGLGPRRRVPTRTRARMLLGITTDEASRMKRNREWWIENRYPLAEQLGWSRAECKAYMARVHPEIPIGRSACAGCPYRSDQAWIDVRESDPELFENAVRLDEALRAKEARGHRLVTGVPYLHRSRRPLREAVEAAMRTDGASERAESECEGYCGL